MIRSEGHAGAHAALPHVSELRSCPEPPARTAASFPTDWPRSPPTPSYKTTQISVRGALEAPCTAGLRQGAARAAPGLQGSRPFNVVLTSRRRRLTRCTAAALLGSGIFFVVPLLLPSPAPTSARSAPRSAAESGRRPPAGSRRGAAAPRRRPGARTVGAAPPERGAAARPSSAPKGPADGPRHLKGPAERWEGTPNRRA